MLSSAALTRRAKPHLRCDDCRMHRSLCICALLPRIATRTRVVVVLHQLEARKSTNTGALAARCLENSVVVYRGRAPGAGAAEPLGSQLSIEADPLLLYPHPSATPLGAWPGATKPTTLIVPDGTWPQTVRTCRRLRALAELPCVSLPAPGIAVDRLRDSARPDRLATLEAVALALGILEGPSVRDALMRVYRIMTERTLWTNGRVSASGVTGGLPAGVRSHDPLKLGP
jgi:DTW domain-containing protein YfiP